MMIRGRAHFRSSTQAIQISGPTPEYASKNKVFVNRSGPWMHILYQNRFDAQKALSKDGMQINGVLIVGVKPLDPMQRQALNERINNQGFMTLPPPSCSQSFEPNPSRTAQFRPNYLQNGTSGNRQPTGAIAAPAKSLVSKVVDLMLGV